MPPKKKYTGPCDFPECERPKDDTSCRYRPAANFPGKQVCPNADCQYWAGNRDKEKEKQRAVEKRAEQEGLKRLAAAAAAEQRAEARAAAATASPRRQQQRTSPAQTTAAGAPAAPRPVAALAAAQEAANVDANADAPQPTLSTGGRRSSTWACSVRIRLSATCCATLTH
jgi:hypothetical protein